MVEIALDSDLKVAYSYYFYGTSPSEPCCRQEVRFAGNFQYKKIEKYLIEICR